MNTSADYQVGAVLAGGANRLTAAGVPNPRRTAAEIWAGLFGVELASVWVSNDQPTDPEQAARFEDAVTRLVAGEPLQYVLGHAGFRTLALQVDPRVLIPRPETEGLVERVLAWCSMEADRWGTAADIGTGSGCIALSLAAEGRFSRIVATDISAGALQVARLNAASIESDTLIEFRLGPLFDPLGQEEFDVLVANPPYLTLQEFEEADRSVAAYEPKLALVSGADGLDHLDRLLVEGRDRVVVGGLFALEVDSTRACQTLAMARRVGWIDARIEEDLFGRPRYLLATKGVVT